MTLTDARRTLLDYRKGVIVTSWSLNEAIDLAIKVLPSDPPRPTCEERFRQIAEAVRVQYDIEPFTTRSRKKAIVCWRQCIWMKLKNEGYPNHRIATATGWDHATIWWGVTRLKDYLASGDPLAVNTWNALINTIKLPRYYGD